MDSIPQHLTSLDTSPQYESIRIFMNSNSNEISLSNNSSVAVQIKIFDIMGRFIQEYSLAAFEEKKISFNNQNAGIYLIQYNSMYCSGSKKVLKVR